MKNPVRQSVYSDEEEGLDDSRSTRGASAKVHTMYAKPNERGYSKMIKPLASGQGFRIVRSR